MLRIGCHLSSSKGYCAMAKDALKIHANTFQYFSRNPRGGNAKALDQDDISRFLLQAKANDIHPFLAHAPYTLNGCSADPTLRDFAKRTMADDLARLESTPGNLYNFHPGSHVKQGTDVGISYIADMLNEILKPDQTTTILLETMSGKGSEVGKSFEELKTILSGENREGFRLAYGVTEKDFPGMKIESISEDIANDRSIITISMNGTKVEEKTENSATDAEKDTNKEV